jgi:hypothetical protein
MAYPLIVASVALSFGSFPSAAQPLFDQASSASGLMHLAPMRVPNCKGVKAGGRIGARLLRQGKRRGLRR